MGRHCLVFGQKPIQAQIVNVIGILIMLQAHIIYFLARIIYVMVNYDHNKLDGWKKNTSCINCLISPQEIALTMDARVNGETMEAVLTSQDRWTSNTLDQRSTSLRERN